MAEIAFDIQERYEIELKQMGADLDYTHLLCSVYPKKSIGSIVGNFKSITTLQFFKRFSKLKKELWSLGF